MTIDSQVTRQSFALNAPQEYIYTIENSGVDSIVVFEVDANLVYTEVTNYDNVLTGSIPLWDGGTITFTSAHLAGTTRVEVWRRTAVEQLIDYQAYDAFPAEVNEFGLDKITMILQEHGLLINSNVERIKDLEDGSSGGGGGLPSNIYIPLAGTDIGFPVTGPISFQASDGNEIYSMQTDVFGPDSFGFVTERNGTSFIIATKDDGGVIQGFSFTEDGQITIPSNLGDNQEGWQIGAGSVLGDDDVLIMAPVNALGNVRTHSAAIVVSPTYTFSFSANGNLVAPRSTVAGDQGKSLVTKDYAESLLPPGGGEANTSSSPGASGEELTMAKSGIDLPFKRLIAGTDITLTATVDGITINAGAGGGGLPAGNVHETLRNDAGTNTYVATGGLLVDDTGQVSVGPGAVAPLVPLQVKGQISVLDGGAVILNSPTNAAGSRLETGATNRTLLESPAGGGIDIKGNTSVGDSVSLYANDQKTFMARGSTASWAEIYHNAVLRIKTLLTGVQMYGELILRNADDTANLFSVDSNGDGHFEGNCDAFGTMAAAALTTFTGGVTSALQVNIGSVAPTQPDHATRKDYVDDRLAAKADDSAVVRLSGTQQVSGKKEFNGGLTAGNPANQPDLNQFDASFRTSILLEGMPSNSAPNVVNAFGLLSADSSDITLKKDIVDTKYGLQDILWLRAVDFNWKQDGRADAGFIAQEVQHIIPECTPVNPDGLLGFKDRPIIAALVKSVQELTARIEELENKS